MTALQKLGFLAALIAAAFVGGFLIGSIIGPLWLMLTLATVVVIAVGTVGLMVIFD